MSDDFLKGLKQTEEGKYIVTMKYPDVLPVLRLASIEQTRKSVQQVFDNRCANINLDLLLKIVQLRQGKLIFPIFGVEEFI